MAERYFAQPSGTSAQQHFASVPSAQIERSRFDRSHGHKTSLLAGKLTPVYVDEVLPGDTFTMSTTVFSRFASALQRPVMDNIYQDLHYFFVPYRLVWDNWQRFMGERLTPADDPSLFQVPQTVIQHSEVDHYTLANYLGIPRNLGTGQSSVSALPFRAYVLIWNEWYRDQNLQNPYPLSTGDGPDTGWSTFDCLRRGKRHDYFTSALPWPQKGAAVTVPLGTSAIVKTSTTEGLTGAQPSLRMKKAADGTAAPQGGLAYRTSPVGVHTTTGETITMADAIYPSNLIADLTTATAITINDLRTAFQVQKLLERDARGGTRYIELVLNHFGVASDDLRATRPVYLGGGTQMMNVNPIAATAQTGTDPNIIPVASLAAFGQGITKGGFQHSFTEHGVIIGLLSVRADLTYQQGIPRWFRRTTRYDFYWPSLAHLGEQVVYQGELYCQGTIADAVTFGYQERYAEYRYKPSMITGMLNSSFPTSLDIWHVAQDFSAPPVLNSSFIEEFPPLSRSLAVTTGPQLITDIWFSLQCQRPMPVYSVPGLIDHF